MAEIKKINGMDLNDTKARSDIQNKADKDHTHDEFADKNHIHDNYATKTYVNDAVANAQLGGGDGIVAEGTYPTLYTFNDAYAAWCSGEKFPIAFFGDSTIDGVNTSEYSANTIGEDSSSPNTFCAKLQRLLRTECNSDTLRIYNAGFSGKTLDQGLQYFTDEFTGSAAYSDVKMIGIGFGINDRLYYDDIQAYRDGVYSKTKELIDMCYAIGVQPFLLTTQATNECGVASQYASRYPFRNSMSINIAANGAKRDLAIRYNLPLIDINKFTELFLINSNVAPSRDHLHFDDAGHEYEAGMIFANICPRVIFIEGNHKFKINYSNQNLKHAVPEDKITLGGDFKVYAKYSKDDTNDIKIMDCYVFIVDEIATISAYKGDTGATYVLINGMKYTLKSGETVLLNLDLGLHHIEVFTGNSAEVDFQGFIINDVSNNTPDNPEVPGNDVEIMNTLSETSFSKFRHMNADLVPAVIAPNVSKDFLTNDLSGYTITRIILPIDTAGDITIGKVDMTLMGKGEFPVYVESNIYSVVSGYNTITLNISLGENEALALGKVGDTGIPYYIESASVDKRLFTSAQYKDAVVSTIGIPIAVYVTQ